MKVIQKENVALVGLVGTTLLAGGLLTIPGVVAGTDAVDTITITVPSSCSMSSTIATGNEHTAEINNGQYDSAIGESTIKAFCNDNEGFAIYAIGYTDNELGKNVLTSSELGATHDIVTGTAISGNTSNWAMKLSTITSPTPTYPIIIAGSTDDTEKEQDDPDFSDFIEVPDEYEKVAYRNSATDINPEGSNTAEGSTLKTTYQAYISPTQASGEYTGQVKYTMLHPHTEPAPYTGEKTASGKICYYANASDSEGTMGCQDIVKERDWSSCSNTDYESYCYDSNWNEISIEDIPELDTYVDTYTLLASNYSRTGYGFAGWSDKFDYATNPNAKFYGPQEDITFTVGQYTGSNNGLSLYAVWVESEGSLQDASKVASVCNRLTTAPIDGTASLSSVSALTDQRDNQTYAIAKLADGNCWMIENLRLESRDTMGDNRFDSSITNASLAQGYGTSATYGNFGGLADAESTGFTDTYTANSLYYSGTQEGTASINIGTSDFPAYRMPRYNNLNTQSRAQNNPNTNTFNDDNTDGGMYSYGNYYTWHAAIADLTYNGTNNQSTTGTSLCPTGWHLPTGGSVYGNINIGGINITGDTSTFREFYNLGYKTMSEVKTAHEDCPNSGYAQYTSNTTNIAGKTASQAFRSFPNNFLYSGRFGTSSAYYRGSYGDYWSSTAGGHNSITFSYILGLGSYFVAPGTEYMGKEYGLSIRCVSGS